MKIEIPNYGTLTIQNVIFDINGTLQFEGKVSEGLIQKFKELEKEYHVYLVSSDTRGNLAELAKKLDTDYIKIDDQEITATEGKKNELLKLGKEVTAAIGNGNNDSLMLKHAILGLVIIGNEGASTKTFLNADVVFHNPIAAINFLLEKKMIIATLRK
ncbi:MAG: hypothetical protein R6U96_02730 [Promethearchaeia archaeon]